jgi:hypothetical protein
MAEADTVAAVLTAEAVEDSTVVVAECARVAEAVRVAGLFLLLLLGLDPEEASLLLVRALVTVLPDVQETIFRGLAVTLQTGMGV